MFEDMAMPDIDEFLSRRHGVTGEDQLASLLVCWDIESLAIQHLKLHEMNMQGMHVASNVDERPDLSAAGLGVFGNRFVPACITQKSGDDVAVGRTLFF